MIDVVITDFQPVLAGLQELRRAIETTQVKMAADISELEVRIAGIEKVLRTLVTDDPIVPEMDIHQAGVYWNDAQQVIECLYCNGDYGYLDDAQRSIIEHEYNCPILLGQRLLAQMVQP